VKLLMPVPAMIVSLPLPPTIVSAPVPAWIVAPTLPVTVTESLPLPVTTDCTLVTVTVLLPLASVSVLEPVPPSKVDVSGRVLDPRGPIGFSAALAPYLSALGETALERQQLERLKAAADPKTRLYGAPVRYYDQNLALFAIGAIEKEFRFDADGALKTQWNH